MVFPRFVRPETDPEFMAEEELNRKNGNPTTPPTPKAENGEDAVSNGSNSPASNAGGGAQCCSSSKVHPTKESKAERKKRSRGVSGSSIKKDGGKFDMGLEDFHDLAIDPEEEEEYQAEAYEAGCYNDYNLEEEVEEEPEAPPPPPKKPEKKPKSSEEWQAGILAMATRYYPFVGEIILPLIFEEANQPQVMARLHQELQIFFAHNYSGILSDDLFSSYRLTIGLSQAMFEERMVRVLSFFEFIRDQPKIVDKHREHAIDFLKFVQKTIDKFSNNPMIPQPSTSLAVPEDKISRMVKDFCDEHNTQEIAEQLNNIDIGFHSYFVHQAAKKAVGRMSMDLMYFIVSALKELYDNCIISDISIKIGLSRLAKDVKDMETDLPAAAALLHLLSSYAIGSLPVTEDCFAALPPPKHFLSRSGGKLTAIDPTEDLPALSVKNYFLLN